MGRGGAQLGKPVKGRNKEKKEKKTEDVDKQIANDLKMLEEYERLSKLADLQRERLKKLHQQELVNTKVNQKILLAVYRKFMREEKVESLRKEVEILAQNHEHDLARKDALIDVLIRDIESAENQLLTARRSHVILLDKLLRIQEEKLSRVDTDFELKVKKLKQVYRSEIQELIESHQRSVNEITEVLHIANENDKERANAAKTAHEAERERVRNTNLESLNELRITLENRIDDLERLFNDAHIAYLEQTEEKTKLFKQLQQEDKLQARRLRRRQRALEKSIKELASWRQRTRVLQITSTKRHEDLKAQIQLIIHQCIALKSKTSRSRRNDEQKLCETALQARQTIKNAESQLEQASNILHLAELCKKLETERERVLPVDPAYTSGAIAIVNNQSSAEGQLLSVESGEGVGIGTGAGDLQNIGANRRAGDPDVDWTRLDHLMRKIGKVTLEKIAITQEKLRLQEENQKLKSMLDQYLSGIAVRPDAVDKPNPLLVVNGAVGLADAPTLRASEGRSVSKVVIEGSVAMKQYQFTGMG